MVSSQSVSGQLTVRFTGQGRANSGNSPVDAARAGNEAARYPTPTPDYLLQAGLSYGIWHLT
jgi:hypothetical protein